MNLDRIIQLWDRMRTSLWFVPSIMAFGALVLAIATPYLDRLVPDEWLEKIPLVFSGQPDGARAVLTTIATSMIGIAGVVFSMTIVSLQLASSQFGPRLLRTFLRDTGNQVVLGTFLGTFLYCIVVLPTVATTGDSYFVPHIAVSLAVLQAIVSLGMLVYYIDHVAQSIHADAVMHAVGIELDSVINELYPEPIGEPQPSDADNPPKPAPDSTTDLCADCSGYLRFVNGDALMKLSTEHGLILRLEIEPGAFVIPGDCLASVETTQRLSEETECDLRAAFVMGAHRTALQDVTFAFEQLTEMAQRAMSPGINDPTTATHCIDRISAGIASFVERDKPQDWRRDKDGNPRIRTKTVGLGRILDVTVDPIARTAGVHLVVWVSLLRVLESADRRARREQDPGVIRDYAERLLASAKDQLSMEHDHERLDEASAWLRVAEQESQSG